MKHLDDNRNVYNLKVDWIFARMSKARIWMWLDNESLATDPTKGSITHIIPRWAPKVLHIQKQGLDVGTTPLLEGLPGHCAWSRVGTVSGLTPAWTHGSLSSPKCASAFSLSMRSRNIILGSSTIDLPSEDRDKGWH